MEAAFFRWLLIPELGTSGMEIERQLLQFTVRTDLL